MSDEPRKPKRVSAPRWVHRSLFVLAIFCYSMDYYEALLFTSLIGAFLLKYLIDLVDKKL